MHSLLISLLLGFTPAGYAADPIPYTPYEEIVEAAFPSTTMSKKYIRLTDEQLLSFQLWREGVLQLIESTGTPWLAPMVAPGEPTREQLKSILSVIRKTPVWICPGDCNHCGARTNGCTLSKEFGGSVASVALLSGCLIPGGPCSERETNWYRRVAKYSEVLDTLQRLFAEIAFVKLFGPTHWLTMKPAVVKAETVLSEYLKSGSAMLQRCQIGRAHV